MKYEILFITLSVKIYTQAHTYAYVNVCMCVSMSAYQSIEYCLAFGWTWFSLACGC